MSSNYSSFYGEHADRHYIKDFKKKYKHRWEITSEAITAICDRIDNTLETATCDTIKCVKRKILAKLDFAIARTKESPKKSGCRAILLIDQEEKTVEILLVYHKKDIEHINNNETLAWKGLVSDLYPNCKELL